MWGLGIWLHVQIGAEKKKKNCAFTPTSRHTPSSWHTHTHHTYFLASPLLIFLLHPWLTSGGHKFNWYLNVLVLHRLCDVYCWSCSSPMINYMFSNCGIWKRGRVGKTEKESKEFVHSHTHFLTHPQIHHTHKYTTPTSCFTTFDLHATGSVDLKWP